MPAAARSTSRTKTSSPFERMVTSPRFTWFTTRGRLIVAGEAAAVRAQRTRNSPRAERELGMRTSGSPSGRTRVFRRRLDGAVDELGTHDHPFRFRAGRFRKLELVSFFLLREDVPAGEFTGMEGLPLVVSRGNLDSEGL